MMFRSIVIQGSMVGFWNAMPTRKARAATSRPPTMTTPVDGCTSPLTSRRMVDLPHPEGPTSATNSPSAIRSVVVARAGTARAPRPKVTEASDSSMAMGAAEAGTGKPENSECGCMRIMAGSACKPNASKTCLGNQGYRE